jgi:hypothetical protein
MDLVQKILNNVLGSIPVDKPGRHSLKLRVIGMVFFGRPHRDNPSIALSDAMVVPKIDGLLYTT